MMIWKLGVIDMAIDMNHISLDSLSVSQLLELFKKEMQNLDDLVTKLNFETNEIKKSWEGRASDQNTERINGLNTTFESIKKKNEGYVKFIDSTIERYKSLDESQRKFVSDRTDAFDTDFYG